MEPLGNLSTFQTFKFMTQNTIDIDNCITTKLSFRTFYSRIFKKTFEADKTSNWKMRKDESSRLCILPSSRTSTKRNISSAKKRNIYSLINGRQPVLSHSMPFFSDLHFWGEFRINSLDWKINSALLLWLTICDQATKHWMLKRILIQPLYLCKDFKFSLPLHNCLFSTFKVAPALCHLSPNSCRKPIFSSHLKIGRVFIWGGGNG